MATMFGMMFSSVAMSGADFLFRNLEKDKYLEETRRYNDRMISLEAERLKWDQQFMKEQREFERKRLRIQDAKEQQNIDRAELDKILLERRTINSRISSLRLNNPYLELSSGVLTVGIVVCGVYVMKKMRGKGDE